jgi:hypothetical protein
MSDYKCLKERLSNQLIQEADETPETCNAKTNECNDSLNNANANAESKIAMHMLPIF